MEKMEIKIVQQNLDKTHKKDEAYTKGIINKLLTTEELEGQKPHVLLLSEFCYCCQEETIIKSLKDEGYNIFLPRVSKEDYKKNSRYACVCMMAVHKEFDFKQNKREELDENELRYITGTLTIKKPGKKMDMEMFFTHIPQTALNDPKYKAIRMEYKDRMLSAAYCFFSENSGKYTFLGGDFNSDIENEDTSLLPIFKKLYDAANDTEPAKKPTYKEKRLDYALVSDALKDCACETEVIETGSDHRALLTKFEL